jgi:hypothetical protein
MPTLSGYLLFIRGLMGISSTYLPDASADITTSYNLALEIVNLNMAGISSTVYTACVYNLAGDILINIAVDQTGQTFFADLRTRFGINSFTPGVVSESHDGTSGQSLLNPDFMGSLTLSNLQNLKTPYGRQYLAYAQSLGPVAWGVS